MALLLAVLCSVAIVRGRARAQSVAVLGALLLFAGPRLPTGNLWDTLLDPLLWCWALASLARAGLAASDESPLRRLIPDCRPGRF